MTTIMIRIQNSLGCRCFIFLLSFFLFQQGMMYALITSQDPGSLSLRLGIDLHKILDWIDSEEQDAFPLSENGSQPMGNSGAEEEQTESESKRAAESMPKPRHKYLHKLSFHDHQSDIGPSTIYLSVSTPPPEQS